MKTVYRYRLVYLIAIICSFILASRCIAEAQAQPDSKPSSLDASLNQFIQNFGHDKATHYIAAFHDLNDDGKLEAIVYLTDSKWCGSGGCNTLILTQDRNSWRIITKITITRPPILVLPAISHGWHNIGVWVQGGSIKTGYEAELIFDGTTYPKNPTVPPARQLKEKSTGNVIIPLAKSEGK